MMRRLLSIAVLFTALSLLPYRVNAQCSACKASVETHLEGQEGSTGVGLNSGIIYLLVMPYLAAMGVGVAWYYHYKRNKRVRIPQ